MRIAALLLCALLALFCGRARAQSELSFDGAMPGQGIEAIIRARPDWRWRMFYTEDANELVGAIASSAVELADWRWTLRLGTTYARSPNSFAYSFNLDGDWRFDREGACLELMSRTIADLEPKFGAYGPGAWADMEPSMAYLDERLRASELAVGARSRVRSFARDSSRYFFAARDLDLGQARRASVLAINTRSHALAGWGYDCTISVGFKTLRPSDQPAPAGAPLIERRSANY